MNRRDDESLDRFLDEALSQYSHEAPRPGLEQRILANLATAESHPRRSWLWAVVPVCAAAMLVAVLWLLPSEKAVPRPSIGTAIPAPSASRTPRPQPSTRASRKRPALRAAQKGEIQTASVAPRLPTFPSQVDESQARLLLQFVQGNPALAQQVVADEEQFQKLAYRNSAPSEIPNGEQQEER